MASAAQIESQGKATESGAESPTTARPLEMDDDEAHESGAVGDESAGTAAQGTTTPTKTTSTATPASDTADTDVLPVKPPRPVSEAQQNETILKEAFPTVEQSVIKAVLRASGGKVEPAFHALLEMTDPDAVIQEPEEESVPARPPRPEGHTPMSQMEADELYARQLAEHYDNVGAYEARTSSLNRGGPRDQQVDDEDREHSFLEDELPVIRENLRKGFIETQTKVNGWITNLRKRIEENLEESEEQPQRDGQQRRQSGERSRRSGDYDRYDADPQVLSDDFAGMKFSGDGTPVHPLSGGLHRPPPPSKSPRPNDGRRVGFKEGHEEINMYDSSPKVPAKDTPPTSAMKASKWQPLSDVVPEPITDNDPFSLGDSEDEKDTKEKPKDATKDIKSDDAERLKQAAAEAMADSLVEPPKEGDTATKK